MVRPDRCGYHGQRRRRRWPKQLRMSPYLSLLVMQLLVFTLVLLLTVEQCTAQRAAVNLGSKLKNLVNKKGSSAGAGIVTSDNDEDGESSDGESWWSWKNRVQKTTLGVDAVRVLVALVAVMAGTGIFMKKNKSSTESIISNGDQEEIYVDEWKADQGFLNQVEIGFQDVTMKLKQKGKKEDRIILQGIRGHAKQGRMLAIMGPSGSGKSSLIHALAGKVKENKKLSLSGMRYVNGEPISGDSMIPSAFIEQEVNFFPHMTVRETLAFRVELKLAKKLGKRARDDVVDDLMDALSLSTSANTIVGNSKIRGISGGERKRLSIACEMINSPPVIFLDEPTSGLDSYQATQVVEALRKLADKGKTIIAVIHQPSQHVFSMFDDLLLLSEGKQMYFGDVASVRSYMEKLGYKAIKEMGTAEHVLECISRVNGGSAEEEKSIERINRLARECHTHAKEIVVLPEYLSEEEVKKHKMKHIAAKTTSRPAANILRQFKLLLGRALQETLRGKGAIIIKTVQQVTLGVVYGGIYHLGNNQASIQDRIGLLSLIAIGATNMATAAAIRSFPKEKAIISDEMSAKLYSTLPYFVAKAISEIPLIGIFNSIFSAIIYPLTGLQKGKFRNFLGLTTLHAITSEAVGLLISSVSPSSDIALALFPPIIVLNIVFDGKNISEENTPRLLRWLPKVGLIRWGFEGLAINEFEGLEFTTSGPPRGPVAKTGQQALERYGLYGKTLGDVVRAQTYITAVCWILSYLGLSLTKQRFMVMEHPEK